MPKRFPIVGSSKPTIRPGIKKAVKAVGKVVTAPIRFAGKQIEKEMKMNKAKDASYKKAGKALNAKYSK